MAIHISNDPASRQELNASLLTAAIVVFLLTPCLWPLALIVVPILLIIQFGGNRKGKQP